MELSWLENHVQDFYRQKIDAQHLSTMPLVAPPNTQLHKN
jgi:hypothetical protein